jgi:hypothetical protein
MNSNEGTCCLDKIRVDWCLFVVRISFGAVPRLVIRGCSSQPQKIAKARRATSTPSNGLETANQKDTFQPERWVVRVRSPCSLCVPACTELNQPQRQALSSTLRLFRNLKVACEAFMVLINKCPKCLRRVVCQDCSEARASSRTRLQTRLRR